MWYKAHAIEIAGLIRSYSGLGIKFRAIRNCGKSPVPIRSRDFQIVEPFC